MSSCGNEFGAEGRTGMKIHRKTLTQFRAMMIEMTFAF